MSYRVPRRPNPSVPEYGGDRPPSSRLSGFTVAFLFTVTLGALAIFGWAWLQLAGWTWATLMTVGAGGLIVLPLALGELRQR